MKMTRTLHNGLKWFAGRGWPVGLFDVSAPSEIVRKRLIAAGYIERLVPAGGVGMIRFQITDAGRKALSELSNKESAS